MSVRAGSAAARLRRTRMLMTVLFTATTAVCLAALAILALQIDSSSKNQQLVSDVTNRAGGLARALYFDSGTLHTEPVQEDELAVGAALVGVYQLDSDRTVSRTAYLSPTRSADLTDPQRAALVADVLDTQGTVDSSFTTPAGEPLTWAAAPVYLDDTIGAVLIVGQDASTLTAAHDRLFTGLVLGCGTLLAAAGIAGYALSGRAIRPATVALARQEQFLTEAAHELRTPLTTLRLTLETGGTDAPERARSTVDRIDHLVTALFLRARISAGTFQPERIRLRLDQLAEQIVDESADRENTTLTTEPVVVVGDPVLLAQAIRNLIDNAYRHAPGTVHVAVTRNRITVTDHGPGIPADQRSTMLQAGAGTGDGTGTGLAIVGWVVHLHGSELTLGDSPGGGLRAEIVFPADA